MARASIIDRNPIVIPGIEVLLAVEVVFPGSGSERTDRVRKLKEYAALGIPQYWLAEFVPSPSVQIFALDMAAAAYRRVQTVGAGSVVEAKVEADTTITVRFDPQVLTEF
ncbi:Uma2 family endonuclease [Actinomadura citrea]|uniref:Putative restriction endonuclease domain-containing protein n=1 Tax=Actinomadura citrea TaxID=46158 RepID=A0A7Y9GFK9_9ACTN|nr:Uma2 family endonuclease [Actinomadura citrea]NYE15601.1 hypothetical protein [Actinomadura citrea]GGT65961.1 hypothetical protein GCM10010177_23750 [Actinomadura citrea]